MKEHTWAKLKGEIGRMYSPIYHLPTFLESSDHFQSPTASTARRPARASPSTGVTRGRSWHSLWKPCDADSVFSYRFEIYLNDEIYKYINVFIFCNQRVSTSTAV